MAHQSGLLKRMKADSAAKTAASTWRNLMTACQMVTDAALLAAHDVFQLGPGRAAKFVAAIKKYTNEIAALLVEDGKTDRDYIYTREKVDQRLKQICGEDFDPWEVRYGEKGG